MENLLPFTLPELASMKSCPERVFYRGKTELLERRKVAIVGSRDPFPYAQEAAYRLAAALAKVGVCVVSGAAMGIDAAAHRGAGSANTIGVLPCGIDLRYPAINRTLIGEIERDGLLLSQFDPGFRATNWSFVVRNELVVALGEVLVVAQADEGSGSMSSVEYALETGKKIYVLPHRMGESGGTNRLLSQGKAEAIYDIETFVARFGKTGSPIDASDPFLRFCAAMPTYEEALSRFPERVFAAELGGEIEVRNGRVFCV